MTSLETVFERVFPIVGFRPCAEYLLCGKMTLWNVTTASIAPLVEVSFVVESEEDTRSLTDGNACGDRVSRVYLGN